jgi:hypothetical protein
VRICTANVIQLEITVIRVLTLWIEISYNPRQSDSKILLKACLLWRCEMGNDKAGIFCSQPLRTSVPAVGGDVVKNPEDPSSLIVGCLGHHVVDQTIKGFDPTFPFASAKELCSMDIESRKVGPSTAACVFVPYLRIYWLSASGAVFERSQASSRTTPTRPYPSVICQTNPDPDFHGR